MADNFGQYKIDYTDGIWYASLPIEARAASEQLKSAGWWFHWGDERDPRFCKACKANLPKFSRFTPHADKAAPFRQYFTREAELAFLEEAEGVKQRAEQAKKIDELSRAADAGDIDIPAPPGLDYRGYQRAGIAWITSRDSTLLADEQGLGKAQPVDTPVLTPTGWRPIGELAVGDQVIGGSGNAVNVTGVFHRGVMPCLRVTFNDRTSTRVAHDHLWAYQTHNDQQRSGKWRVAETQDLLHKIRTPKGDRNLRIPLVGPVQFDGAPDLPINPYLLGVLLGDGHLAHHPATYTPGDEMVPEFVGAVLPDGCLQTPVQQPDRAVTYRIVTEPKFAANPVLDAMRNMGLSGIGPDQRMVPEPYLFAGERDRLHLLQGLLDTDGEIQDSIISFSSASRLLVEQVAFLCQSLGGVTRFGKPRRGRYKLVTGDYKDCRMSYRVNLSFPVGLMPFRARANAFVPKTKYPPSRIFDSIEPCGDHEVACISVDAPDGLYVTEHCIVTHNTIQVLGAINMLSDVREVLVVAPPHLVLNWVREAKKWLVRPINAVVLTTSYDIPPPPAPGTVNLLVTNYEKLIEQKGADLKKELEKPAKKLQRDVMGLRRALVKVAENPKAMNRILVLSDAPENIEWTESLTQPLADKLGAVRIMVTFDKEQVLEAQQWVAEHPSAVSVVVVHVKPEHEALAAIQGEKSPWVAIRQALLGFKLSQLVGSPKTSSARGVGSTAYDLLVKDKVITLRTGGRGKGLHAALMDNMFDILVLDEMHALNNPKSSQSIAIFGKEDRGQMIRPGLDKRAKKRVYLSGTPLRNVVCEMWGMLHSMAPRTFDNFFKFAKRYCGAIKERFGWDFSGATNTAELERILRTGTEHRGLMIGRLKADVAKDLPPKTRHVFPLDPGEEGREFLEAETERTAEIQEQIDSLEVQALIAQIEGDETAYADAVSRLQAARSVAFDEMAKERAYLGQLKVPPSVEYIQGLLDEGVKKVIVFAHHRTVIDGLTDGLRKYNAAIIDGRVSGKGRIVRATGEPKVMDRIDVVDAFQNDPSIRVFIGNFKAAGTGITLTAASTVVMVESTWTGADNAQAEDRAHRIGTTEHVHVIYLVLDGSLDQRMLEAVVRKMDTAYDVLHARHEHPEAPDLTAIEAQALSTSTTPTPSGEKAPRERREAATPQYTPEVRKAAQEAIHAIATVCDGAVRRDCVGFSGTWVGAGHWLAGQASFTDRMVGIALRIISYHHRQVPDDLLAILNVEAKKKGPVIGPAPHRVRLRRIGRDLYVEDTSTEPDAPVQVRALYPVDKYEGTAREVELSVDENDENHFVAEGLDVWLAPGAALSFEQRLDVTESKSKFETRWFSGRWQRSLKQGWTDIEYKWLGDDLPLAVVPVRVAARKAPTPVVLAPPKPATPKATTPTLKAPTPKPATPKPATPRAPTPKPATPRAPTPKAVIAMRARTKAIDPDVMEVLQNAQIEGNTLRLVGQLDRKLYLKTNDALEALGGKWDRKLKAHVFAGDPREAIGVAIEGGTYASAKDAEKEAGFFPTSEALARQLVGHVKIARGARVLEPSAGKGALADAVLAVQPDVDLHMCELLEENRWALVRKGYPKSRICTDFIEYEPDAPFDVIIMNPPFAKAMDIVHVTRAYGMLAEGGTLAAIMSPGFQYRQDKKAKAFRDLLESIHAAVIENPDKSFHEAGTDVRTVTVIMKRPTSTPKAPTSKQATPKAPKPATPKPATPKPATPKPATPKPATPKPATPKPPKPKPPKPKPPKPKPPKKAPTPAPEVEVEEPRLLITDPIAVDVLGMLEGPQWREIQRRDENRLKIDNGFYLSLRAFEMLVEQGLLGVEDITLENFDPAAGVIAGAGEARYIVHPDGQIMLLADTVSKAKAKQARPFLWVYEED